MLSISEALCAHSERMMCVGDDYEIQQKFESALW